MYPYAILSVVERPIPAAVAITSRCFFGMFRSRSMRAGRSTHMAPLSHHMRSIASPHMEQELVFNPYMDKRQTKNVLAENVERLKGDATYAKFPAKVGQGSIARVLAGQNVRLSTLDALAKGFRLQAWELLFPDLDPAYPPSIRIAEEREELEELRQWRDEVMSRAARMGHGRVVDDGGANVPDGHSKGKGSQSQNPRR
jgi:hypothetical protein